MKLELFMFDTCPYCKMVEREIKTEGRTDVEFHNIYKDPESLDRLVKVGGKEQCPCLFIDGKPMYESSDILKWLRANPQQV